MAYRNIFISKPSTLSIEDANLRVDQDNIHLRIAVEDILSIVIEDQSVFLNSYLLSHLAQHDVLVYTCDRTHMPCTILSPFSFHVAQTKRLRQQIALSLPFKKQTWRQIVKAKIYNQAQCLKICGQEHDDLLRMADEVKSDDIDNREGTAARAYFTRLFGPDFTRDRDTIVNACLNYGYAILRGLIARSLVAHGFIPDLGVHHHSELNNFNLADDFIEPIRPTVDIVIAQDTSLRGKMELSKGIKERLYDIINKTISFHDETHSIGHSVELMIESYIRSIDNNDTSIQHYPILQSPSRHSST